MLYSLAIRLELPFNSLRFTGRPAIVLFLGSWYFGHMVDFCFRKQFFPHLFIKSKHKHIAHIDSRNIRSRNTSARTRHHQIFPFDSKLHALDLFGWEVLYSVVWLVGWFDSLSSQHPLSINHKNYWHNHCVLCM